MYAVLSYHRKMSFLKVLAETSGTEMSSISQC